MRTTDVAANQGSLVQPDPATNNKIRGGAFALWGLMHVLV